MVDHASACCDDHDIECTDTRFRFLLRPLNLVQHQVEGFSIDLELDFAEWTLLCQCKLFSHVRTTYTGIHNMPGAGFDMSFRMQCSENYYGPSYAILFHDPNARRICL